MRATAPFDAPVARDGSGHRAVPDGSGHDRQPLVVGRGPAAIATAGFLAQSGLDPVLAGGCRRESARAVVTLWRPGLELLARLGLCRPVESVGTRVSQLDCLTSGQTWTAPSARRPSLVAIRRSRLESLLRRHLADRITVTNRPVTAVQPTGSGVDVRFEGGIVEPFDTVVTTDRRLLPGPGPTDTSKTIHRWSFDRPADARGPDGATEAWGESRAAFTTPAGDTVHVDLVSTVRSDAVSPLSVDRLAEQFGSVDPSVADALGGVDRSAIQYRQSAYVAPAVLSAGTVGLVGPAAHPLFPGNCLDTALAFEDGWVFADALAYGPEPVADALAEYATRRRRRLRTLTSAVHDEMTVPEAPVDLSGPLDQLYRYRRLAFAHLFDTVATDLGDGIPERL